MSTCHENLETKTIPEFCANDLGIPFKVILVDSVTQFVDKDTGEVVKTLVPNVPGLLDCVAMARILHERKLSGPELKFIRKVFGEPAKKLAEKIGVSPEHLSRCEADDRVLSVGAEKCLRISLFLDNFKIPEDILGDTKVTEKIAESVEAYRNALKRIESILDDMKINPAYSADDELCLAFKIHRREDDLFVDDPNAAWCSREAEQLKVA